METGRRVAIIGAGMAGLVCARSLQQAGASVAIFDKARGPGGRLTTRRRGEARFDHGAQFFTARSEAFASQVMAWEEAGVAAVWPGRFALCEGGRLFEDAVEKVRWVGVPRMSALGRHLAEGLDLHLSARVVSLLGAPGGWTVELESGARCGPFDTVVLSCPGPQAAALIPEECPLRACADALLYEPCWAVMLGYEAAPALEWDGISFKSGRLAWAARDSGKPSRGPGERWVLHASAAWSAEHLGSDPASVVEALAGEFEALAGVRHDFSAAHRWLYALSASALSGGALHDAGWGLGLCGDGLTRPRVEGAWESGVAMARLVEGVK